jgi:hypothetical protein
MIQRNGFGIIFWNKYGEKTFVTIEIIDERLVVDFIQGVVLD